MVLKPYHFISYSSADGHTHAKQLYDAFQTQRFASDAWLDKMNLIPGIDWDIQVRNAIRHCRTLLFIMTPDSIEERSVCKDEWSIALKYQKSVIPLLFDKSIEIPFRLHTRQYIDFIPGFESGLTKLAGFLTYLASPSGELQRLDEKLSDARRALRRASEPLQRERAEADIQWLEDEILCG